MDAIKLFAVDLCEDFQGGGIIAVFSSLEKATEYADMYDLPLTQSLEIIVITVDNPDAIEYTEYLRHG